MTDKPTITFAAYGDSITAYPPWAWPPYASDGVETLHVGGFAHGSYRSYQVAAETTPCTADVTAIMVGTNDVSNAMWAVPIGDTLGALRDIVIKSGAVRAVIAAIAPRDDGFHAEGAAFNTAVRNFTVDMGWRWVDPWISARTADGRYRPGMTSDGIHPTAAVAASVGHEMHYFILAAGRA